MVGSRDQAQLRTPVVAGVGAAAVYAAALLIPFAVTGEWWGMVWFYVAFPMSFAFEGLFGIAGDDHLLVALASLLNAALFGAVVFYPTWLLTRWRARG